MNRFRFLNLADIKLGVDDLLDKRRPALVLSSIGKSYLPMLEGKQKFVNALPLAFTGGRPLAEALGATDNEHDGFGGAIWYLTEAYLRLPVQNASTIESVKRIRAALIPNLSGLGDSYADEAEAAIRRKGELAQIETDLKAIPVNMGGTSLYDWAIGFLGAGEKLSVLLSERADAAIGGRAGSQKLRSETIALLNRVRSAIADECVMSPALPQDLDAQIWGYLDELEKQRAEAVARARKPTVTP